jgi:hypothetical protein
LNNTGFAGAIRTSQDSQGPDLNRLGSHYGLEAGGSKLAYAVLDGFGFVVFTHSATPLTPLTPAKVANTGQDSY